MTSHGFSRRRRSGGATVELIVIFPIMLLLIIGLVDYGRVFYTWVTVSNAARAGAEYGQQRFDTQGDTINQKVAAQTDGNDAGTLTLTPTMICECAQAASSCGSFCPGGAAPEVYIRITASKAVNMYFNYPGLPSSVTISRSAIFRSQ